MRTRRLGQRRQRSNDGRLSADGRGAGDCGHARRRLLRVCQPDAWRREAGGGPPRRRRNGNGQRRRGACPDGGIPAVPGHAADVVRRARQCGTFEKAQEYFFWIALGVPLYVFGQAMNPVIRSDGSPTFAMVARWRVRRQTSCLTAAYFRLPLWYGGRGDCNGCRAGADRWTVHLVSNADEADSPAKGQLPPARAFTGEMRQARP